jgi:hypothetical protein
MPAYYTYFISSLPMLHFGAKPPFSFEKFLGDCAEFILDGDSALLKKLPVTVDEYDKRLNNATIEKWLEFDTTLRNELVKIRAQMKKIEPEKFLRPGAIFNPAISHTVMTAHRNPAILEAEEILDETRWGALDELSFGHYFDIDFLIIYAYKLKILERWEKIKLADKERLLQEVLKKD